MRIYIIGYMGSGKTTTGKELASQLKTPFYDLDNQIEKDHGKSIDQIFTENGEIFFRKLESKTLSEISENTDFVLSTGGGAACFNNNMTFMKSKGITIYLKATPDFLTNRLSNSKIIRPLISGKSPQQLHKFITKHLEERKIFYEMADIIIDAMNPDLDWLVSKLQSQPT